MPQWEAGSGGACGPELRIAPRTDPSAMAVGLRVLWNGPLVQDSAGAEGSESVVSRNQDQRGEVLSGRGRI